MEESWFDLNASSRLSSTARIHPRHSSSPAAPSGPPPPSLARHARGGDDNDLADSAALSGRRRFRFSTSTVYIDVDESDLTTESVILPAEYYPSSDGSSSSADTVTLSRYQSRSTSATTTPTLQQRSSRGPRLHRPHSDASGGTRHDPRDPPNHGYTSAHHHSHAFYSRGPGTSAGAGTGVAASATNVYFEPLAPADIDLHSSLSSILRTKPATAPTLSSALVATSSAATPSRPASSSAALFEPGPSEMGTLFLVPDREMERRAQNQVYDLESPVSVNSSTESLISSESGEYGQPRGDEEDVDISSSSSASSARRKKKQQQQGPGSAQDKSKRRHKRDAHLTSPPSSSRSRKERIVSSSSGSGPFSSVDLSTVSIAAAGLSIVAGLSFSAGYAIGKRSAAHLTVSG